MSEAQRLADKLKSYSLRSGYAWHCHKAADELLRLEAENARMRSELEALRGAMPAVPDWSKMYAAPAAPQPAAQPTDMRTMELAESVGLIGPESRTHDLHGAIQRFHDLIAAEASIKAAQAFAQTLAQEPAGEPVGWINAQALEELRKPEMTWMPAWNRQNCTNPVAIYTRPAVPLSDEQIAEITVDFYGSAIHEDDYGFARAIEAAHKIGGAE